MEDETPRVHARAYLCRGDRDPDEVKRAFMERRQGLVQVVRAAHDSNALLFEMLAAQTFSAADSGGLLAKKLEMDFLLRLAGTTQISEAVKKRGAVRGRRFLLVLADKKVVPQSSALASAELPRKPLTRGDLGRIESAALLNTRRP